ASGTIPILADYGEGDVRYDLDLDSGVVFSTPGMIEIVQRAEDKGFDAVWKGESNSSDPIVTLSALAVHTKTIKLGTAVYHVFGRSPVTMGIQAATLQDLSNGRLLVGLGVSNKTIAAWHSMTFDRPLRRLREYAEVTRAVARGERVETDGEIYPTPPFKLSWKPSHPEVPVFYNLAEFYRDMIGQMGFQKESESIRETYRSGGFRAAQGAVPDVLVEQLPTIAATSAQEARERMQPYLDTGITRVIIPYLPSTDDTAADTMAFLDSWPVG